MKVLLVEDELRQAETVRRGLTAEGCVVDCVHDGPEGLWWAKLNPYDVVVLDNMLPGLNGYDVCRGLREAGVWTPVLMLSAKNGEHDQAEALDLGADDYMTKPLSLVVLLARLRALVRRGAPERPTLLSAGDLTLDPATHAVTRAGRPVNLTPREFALLDFLMRHRGEALSKTEIVRGVWNSIYNGDANIVQVYIGYLRRKIDQPFDRQAIETVWGVGYRLAYDGG